MDVRNLLNQINRNGDENEQHPNELLMSDTNNLMAMRVPNFSYQGDPSYLNSHSNNNKY